MAAIKKTKKKPVKKVATKKVVRKAAKRSKTPRIKISTLPRKVVIKQRRPRTPLDLNRHHKNPIITPHGAKAWESRATFNPSAILADGKVHVIYRAVGEDDVSRIGYVQSDNGVELNFRHPEPIYSGHHQPDKSLPKINYASGGGTGGGCEDPRLTLIGDRVYMIYTAFDGWSSLRLALTSIALEDFLAKIWHWRKPVLISPPGKIYKNWVLFPKKINGRYALLHSLSPKVQIAYLPDLDKLDGKTFIESTPPERDPRRKSWDNWMRGTGPSPLWTKDGWLVLYHAMDLRDPNRYKLGAMLLDHNDPTKILYRSTQPILEPDESYENLGHKAGVVYSCGAVIKDKYLIVYYGGADTVCCVATAELKEFLTELKQSKTGSLKKKISRRGSAK